MKPRPARGEISETPRDASEGAEGRPSFFDGLQDGALVQVRIENRLFMSWLIPKTGTGLSEKVSIVEHDSFHNDCHPLPLFRRKYDLEQKGIGMYYEMPTTKNFERHSRRLGDASLTNYKIMKSR